MNDPNFQIIVCLYLYLNYYKCIQNDAQVAPGRDDDDAEEGGEL
jgi:hypothetical protein